MKRAVSLVPSATDAVVAMGAAECLVGLSADCDQPVAGRALPVVTRGFIEDAAAAADAAAVDRAVRTQLAAQGDLYSLDVDLLIELAPDVVFAEDSCSVCALPSSDVVAALARHGVVCEVVSLDPSDLNGVLSSFSTIGHALGGDWAASGEALEASCRRRLGGLTATSGRKDPPRVLLLDWLEPPFVAGNWVPELVAAAGGTALLASAGTPSRQVETETILASGPSLLVVAPCGLSLAETASGTSRSELVRLLVERSGARVVAFDGRVFFSRPGPQLVEGAEALAAWLVGGGGEHADASKEITELI